MKIKALSLLSGGLDSTLATKLVYDLGIDLEAIYFYTIFCTCNRGGNGCGFHARKITQELNIPLKIVNTSEEYLTIVESPRYGYGSNLNPCIDCRIFIFKKAKEYMKECGARFIITGEVLGERPMSQNLRSLRLIEKEAGLEGLVLRPLSAKLLEPTIPEREGWVDRERLLAIQGRSRKPQIELAQEWGINDYPCPSGGCLLTDPIFSQRVKDLLVHKELDLENVKLLRFGRYFRLSPKLKLVIGRNGEDNQKLLNSALSTDLILQVIETPGPVALARGEETDNFIEEICHKVVNYADKVEGGVKVLLKRKEPYREEIKIIFR
ncbi:MAG: hypothetical protein NC920_04335 [Candidatus Omnitrophica bacterium]|nr:hypothetical protein [Candidatus Omnitrophota bacterium]MCM8798406.1 hypothetical protein [Candidatus Omnitrophota bacterium]